MSEHFCASKLDKFGKQKTNRYPRRKEAARYNYYIIGSYLPLAIGSIKSLENTVNVGANRGDTLKKNF